MRTLLATLSLLTFSLTVFFEISHTSVTHATTSGSAAAENVRLQYLADLDLFYHSLDSLREELHREPLHEQAVITAFYNCRLVYKKAEFLAEYLDPAFMKYFNGPDLPRLNDDPLSLDIIEPEGLQVIEGLVFSDSLQANKKELLTLISLLQANTVSLKKMSASMAIHDRMVLEALRAGVLRIMTLGITGFDAPVSGYSLPEASVSMESMHRAARNYFAFLGKRSPSLKDSLEKAFSGATGYLKANNDFGTFDRMLFIRTYGNPLYGLILRAHKAMGIETMREASPFNVPVNYEADNIFSPSFLNPYFYNRSKIDQENKKSIALGKYLFFDPLFSANNRRSCASCHAPGKAFTDGRVKSLAFDFEGDVGRNAPTLINAVFQGAFFYDLRAKFPEEQIDHVVFSHREFRSDFESVIVKLQASPEYVRLFRDAFPDVPGSGVNGYTINKALADYVRSLTAFNTPFDRYMRRETDTIPEEVKRGFNLFMGKAKCGTCHFAPVFNGTVPPGYTDTESEVLGVPASSGAGMGIDPDEGRFAFRRSPVYKHAFKTPTVRNTALTAPYMHNGAYGSLEEVIGFYNKGGGKGLGLDVPNQTLPSDPLNLSEEEIRDIAAFMRSLTDTTGTTCVPASLPPIPGNELLSRRIVGGEY